MVYGDFCFLEQKDKVDSTTVFVLRDHQTRVTFAHVVQGKSTSHEVYSTYIVKPVINDMNTIGYVKFIFRTD